ncbi:MAG: hypothetical protein A4E32_01663 [Methanomassiliicoccales archaeon PtaU1.Bin124]|nr:MAG: hypothetical protein A4E32_01663 [Methanomassiliicoccales archaeon PtaU1.Bin124]
MKAIGYVAVIAVIACVIGASCISLVNGSSEDQRAQKVRDRLEVATQDYLGYALSPDGISSSVDHNVGQAYFFSVHEDGSVPIPVDSSMVGFVLVIGSDTYRSPKSTLFDPANDWMGTDGEGSSCGSWSSAQIVTSKQVWKIDDGKDHWNGTWRLDVTHLLPGDSVYVLVTPILWYDMAQMPK